MEKNFGFSCYLYVLPSGDLKIVLHTNDRRRFYTQTSICLKIAHNHARSARTYFKSEISFRQTSFRSISSRSNNTLLIAVNYAKSTRIYLENKNDSRQTAYCSTLSRRDELYGSLSPRPHRAAICCRHDERHHLPLHCLSLHPTVMVRRMSLPLLSLWLFIRTCFNFREFLQDAHDGKGRFHQGKVL